MKGKALFLAMALVATCLPTVSGATLEVDGAAAAAHNDVIYLSPALEGWEGLPLGNGRFGAQVWQPGGLVFQFNTPVSGAYGGAIARLTFRTTPSMLTGVNSYTQRLALDTATLTTCIHGSQPNGTIHMRCFIPADTDAMVLEVNDERAAKTERFVELEAWKGSARRIVEDDAILFTDAVREYRFAMAVGVQGAAAAAEVANEHTLRLRISGGQFVVYAAFVGTRQEGADVLSTARERLQSLKAQGVQPRRKAHEEWWRRFWNKSFIQLSSENGVADG